MPHFCLTLQIGLVALHTCSFTYRPSCHLESTHTGFIYPAHIIWPMARCMFLYSNASSLELQRIMWLRPLYMYSLNWELTICTVQICPKVNQSQRRLRIYCPPEMILRLWEYGSILLISLFFLCSYCLQWRLKP